ncbi:hypothetical protein J45TS6_05710 [Paenibacillus sp. J45TS6]|nr:hypothetical protein J45TS6_05710 [Paenibacillus sp. J45TS6]
MQMINKRNNGTNKKRLYTENSIPVNNITRNTGISDIKDVINEEHTLDNGKKYLGTYTFRIN